LGIGLSLVQGLVELHGGSISAHSEGEGKGSEFILRLPICDSTVKTGNSTDAFPKDALRNMRILIVDDNIDAADSLAMLLKMSGHETCIANDGASGLAR